MTDHAYFFLGNCQTQYLSTMIGAVSSADRFFMGHRYGVNLALDGPLVPCVDRRPFFEAAGAARAEGKKTILIVQETSRSLFRLRIAKKRRLFDDFILMPGVHFKTQWPTKGPDGVAISDYKVKRTFDWERHDFLGKLQRCEVPDAKAFSERYWEGCRERLRFYHPGHPTGELMAEVLEAMGGGLSERLPCLPALLQVLRRSEGIYQNSNHTIEPRLGPILGVKWAETDFYRTWQGLTWGSGDAAGRIQQAQEVHDDPDRMSVATWPFQSHFRAALGQAYITQGQRERGVAYLQQAAIELKGHGSLVRRTMNQAVRAKLPDAIEHLLVGVAPHLVVFDDDHPGFRECFQSVIEMTHGREALGRVRDQVEPQSWVSRFIGKMMEAA